MACLRHICEAKFCRLATFSIDFWKTWSRCPGAAHLRVFSTRSSSQLSSARRYFIGLRATSETGLRTTGVSTRRRPSERPGRRKIEQHSPVCGPDWRRCGCCSVFSPGLGPLPTWTDWASIDVRDASPWRFHEARTSAPSLSFPTTLPPPSLSPHRADIDQSRSAQALSSLLDAHAASAFSP